MDLKYHPDFWEFYTLNREEIDYILNFHIMKFVKIVEPCEMFQHLILKLAESELLEQYDLSKGCYLKTYFVHKVQGYALHYIRTISRRPKFFPIDMYITMRENNSDGEERNNNKTLKNHIDYTTRPNFNETIDDTLISDETMKYLRNQLNDITYFIACLYLLDCYSMKEIQDTAKVSYNTILRKITKIKQIVYKFSKSKDNEYATCK